MLTMKFDDGGEFEIIMNDGLNYTVRQKRLSSSTLNRLEALLPGYFQDAKQRSADSDLGDVSPFFGLCWVMMKVAEGAESFADFVERLEHDLFDVFISRPFAYSAEKIADLYSERGFPASGLGKAA